MYKAHEANDLDEALSVLENAARKKKSELKELVANKYHHVRDIFNAEEDNAEESEESGSSTLEEIAKVGQKKIRDVVKKGEKAYRRAMSQMDEKIHENPMMFVGGVALGALILGFLVANHRNGKE